MPAVNDLRGLRLRGLGLPPIDRALLRGAEHRVGRDALLRAAARVTGFGDRAVARAAIVSHGSARGREVVGLALSRARRPTARGTRSSTCRGPRGHRAVLNRPPAFQVTPLPNVL